MLTAELARLVDVHPNTVRLYEQWGYISPVPRGANGYRQYSIVHALQMTIARIVFRQAFIQNNLRKKATGIVVQCGKQQFEDALERSRQYRHYLETELGYSQRAVIQVSQLLHAPTSSEVEKRVYTHKEVASFLQLTEETLRNWERNGLYSVKRTAQQRRLYEESDLNRLLVIRTLRSAHYSIASIRHMFDTIGMSSSVEDIKQSLITPHFVEEFIHVTDALEINLNKAITDVSAVIALLEAYIKGDLCWESLSTTS